MLKNIGKNTTKIYTLSFKDLQSKNYENRKKTEDVQIEKEFYAIIKKLCTIQTLKTTLVLCLHCVPIPSQKDLKEQTDPIDVIYQNQKYLLFTTNVSEASYIESEHPEFCTTGIQGNWIINKNNNLTLIQKNNNIQYLIKNNMFSNYYLQYF